MLETKNTQKDRNSVGVIVGRFQVNNITAGHDEIIQTVIANHKIVIIFLGCTGVLGSKRNPLDYISRRLMLEDKYPPIWQDQHDVTIVIEQINDRRSDEAWSSELDQKINSIINSDNVTLYGSRDSFTTHYKGKRKVAELIPKTFISGSEIRKDVSSTIKRDSLFRAGVIYGTNRRYDSGLPTVDIAVVKQKQVEMGQKEEYSFLLAQKPGEGLYRFVGGFFDPGKDKCLEDTAKRELHEETGIETSTSFEYICSNVVSDWRYKSESDKIITTLFLTEYIYGPIQPMDDIELLSWIKGVDIMEEDFIHTKFVPEHAPLLHALFEKHPEQFR